MTAGPNDAEDGAEQDLLAVYLRPRGEAVTPPWYVEEPELPPARHEPGVFPVWRVIVAAALALFAVVNIASFVAVVVGSDEPNPYLALDTMWLALLVCASGGAIWWVLRRR